MQLRTTTVAALLCLAFQAGAAAAPLRKDRVREDRGRQSLEEVQRAVSTYARLTVFDDVSVQSEAGIVTLTGKVTMPFKKEEIAKRVSAVEGVKSVRNEIGVLPVSIADDALRQRVARAIYGNAAFWRYAAMPNPPIHIVVEDSHVTLTGVVASDMDRTLARSLASGLGELSVTNCLRTEGR
jgi:osmotically-inducible protein OsmY